MTEENNLDDFFAKKDKSKKKSTKSRITPDDINMMLEKKLAKATAKKATSAPKKKEKDGTNSAEPFQLSVKVEEDDGEWKEFEVESEKDYSGLRIQNLQISSKDDEDRDPQDNGHSGDDEDGERRDVPQGPWRAIATPAGQESNTPEPAQPEPEKEVPKSTGKYIPPAARGKQTSSSSGGAPTGTGASGARRKKTAPDVNSQEDFPTLGFASEPGEISGQEFERVKSGGRQAEDPSIKTTKVTIGNKYGALEGKDS